MKTLLPIVAAASIMTACHASAEMPHPSAEKLGTVTFPTSCAPRVQRDFARSVALLHSFSYGESEAAFRAVIAADPNCAIARWGVAMSRFHELWSPPTEEDLRAGWAAISQAGSAGSAREKQLIAAIAAFYKDWEHLPHKVRAQAYSDAMAGAAAKYPNDTEVQAFYALSLLAVAPPEDRSHALQKKAAAILEPIFRDHPDHPGAAHYLIHADDSGELAPRGLAAARAYSKIAPSAPHALHMPSHIFTRLGLWQDSIESNKAAREASRHHGDVGEELHAMDYLVYAYLQRGEENEAEQVVAGLRAMNLPQVAEFKIGYAATAMPVRLAMERRRWSEAAKLQVLPGTAPQVAAIVYWARAVGSARAGRPRAADDDIAAIGACRRKLQAAGNAYWATQVGVLGKEAQAWQMLAKADTEASVGLLREAADEEETLEKLPVTPGPVIPAREQLGDMLLELNRPGEALKELRTALVAAPGRRGALSDAIRAAELAGDRGAASELRTVLAGE